MEAIISKSLPLLAAVAIPEFAPALLVFSLIILLRGRK